MNLHVLVLILSNLLMSDMVMQPMPKEEVMEGSTAVVSIFIFCAFAQQPLALDLCFPQDSGQVRAPVESRGDVYS